MPPETSLTARARALWARWEQLPATTRWWVGAAPTLVVTAIVFWIFNGEMGHRPIGSPHNYDEQFFIWCGWSITKGLAPYRDFLEYKPPMLFITHALAVGTVGISGPGFRLFFTFLNLGALLALQVSLLTRRINRLLLMTVFVGVVGFFVSLVRHDTHLDDAESVGLVYYSLGLAFLLVQSPWRKVTDVVGAAFLACCVLSKEPYALCVIASWATVFLFVDGTTDLKKNAKAYAKRTFLGVGIVIALMLLYMLPSGAFLAYLKTLEGYGAMFRDPKKAYCVVLGFWHPGTPLEDLQNQIAYVRRDLLNLTQLGYLVPLFVAVTLALAKKSRLLLAAGVVTVLCGLYAVTATNCQFRHYYVMPVSGALCFLALGGQALTAELEAVSRLVRSVVLVPLAMAVLVGLWPRLSEEAGKTYAYQPTIEPIPGIVEFVKQNSAPDDRIFTTGTPLLYVLADRISSVRQSSIIDELIEYYPGNTDEEKLRTIGEQLEQHPPKLVVLDPEHGDRKRKHYQLMLFPFLTSHGYQQVSAYVWRRP